MQIDPSNGPFDELEQNEEGEQMPSQARQWILPSAPLHDLYAVRNHDVTSMLPYVVISKRLPVRVPCITCSFWFFRWDNLIYDNTVKEDLLQYAMTFMLFSERGVNTNIIACNRVILLHVCLLGLPSFNYIA